jgi:hypothetical protein
MRELSGLPVGLSGFQDGFCSLESATFLKLMGPTSSEIRLRSALYQVQSQAQIHTVFFMVLDWLSQSASYLVVDINIRRLEIFKKKKNKFSPNS